MKDHITLVYKKIKYRDDAEILREIRNSCREYMTRNNEIITKEQQDSWFSRMNNNYDAYLVYALHHGVIAIPAGFGLIHLNNSESFLTGALIAEYQNLGLGQDLFRFLIKESLNRSFPIKLEVLKTNIRAFKLYQKLGFHIEFETDKLYKMEYKNDSLI